MNPFENRVAASARTAIVLVFLAGLVPFLGGTADAPASNWPLYSHDYDNSNFNPDVSELTADEAPFLRRVWATFNDDVLVPESPPTDFVLEGALGLVYPSAVVGVVASPIVREEILYYVEL